MNDRSKSLNDYIDAYKKLDIATKREEYIASLKELIAIFDGLAETDDIKLEYVKSDEIFDINSEDDFLEAAMVYLEVAKDIIGQYMLQKFN